MKKNRVKFPAKKIWFILAILLASGLLLGYIWKALTGSGYFRVKEVITKEINGVDLSHLKGSNIFLLNLKAEAGNILENYPNYRQVRIVRVLPNRLYVDFVKRKPIAYVKLYKYFTIDEDGFLFNAPVQQGFGDLPVITGLDTKIFGPKPGTRYNIKEANLALNIIKEARKNRVLKNVELRKIDVSNSASVSIFIPLAQKLNPPLSSRQEVIEIKLGSENVKEKITILGGVLLHEKLNLANVRYIDLRFNEPVIRFKDAK